MLRFISASFAAVLCLMLAAKQAWAGDAILVIDSGVVRLCASAAPPGEKLDPQSLVGSRVWTGARSGDRREVSLQAMASDRSLVGVEGGDIGLILAYSEAATFVALQEPKSPFHAKFRTLFFRRAQALGSEADHARITKTQSHMLTWTRPREPKQSSRPVRGHRRGALTREVRSTSSAYSY